MTSHRVVVSREGAAWLADVPDLAGTHTWAKNLASLERNVREAIALAEDLPDGAEAGLDLVLEYRTGDTALDSEATEVRAARISLAAHEAEVSARTSALIRTLTEHGYSVRDTARLAGVAPQRVSQVAPSAARRLQARPRNPTPTD